MKKFEDNILKFLHDTMVQIATDTENIQKKFVARWARHLDEKRFFRFNVEQGLQDIALDEYTRKGEMDSATDAYLTDMTQKLRVRDCT